MSIEIAFRNRKITEILHFTTHRGLVGILSCGKLMSRYRLPKESHLSFILHVNSATRPEEAAYFDKSQNWLDYVNLSISEINKRFFDVSMGWHKDNDIWWCILAFDPQIMTLDGVVFSTTNNGYPYCQRGSGVEGFNALFVQSVTRKKQNWIAYRNDREPKNPTCEQAEVLFPQAVPLEYLRCIYVMDEHAHDSVGGWLIESGLSNVQVVISPQKFNGKPN